MRNYTQVNHNTRVWIIFHRNLMVIISKLNLQANSN